MLRLTISESFLVESSRSFSTEATEGGGKSPTVASEDCAFGGLLLDCDKATKRCCDVCDLLS